jgi:hypothetical protein
VKNAARILIVEHKEIWKRWKTISNLANATTQQISSNIGGNDHTAVAAIAMANFGIPLTGSI